MADVVALKTFYTNIPGQPATPLTGEAAHFNIFEVDGLQLPRHRKVSYSRRSFYKISVVTGLSNIHYSGQSFEVTDTVLVFTNPMVPYFWELTSTEQSGYFCIFTEDFFSRFGSIKDYPVFQSADTAVMLMTAFEALPFKEFFRRMLSELQGDYAYKYDLLRNLLMELIHAAQKMQPSTGKAITGSNASERIAGLFAELLERQFPIDLSNQSIQLKAAVDFARQLNVHVNHLNKALKEITGHTTTQLISARILQEARILLRSTRWTITEIGWSLGFEEPNHFSGFFKKGSGLTPKAYRQSTID